MQRRTFTRIPVNIKARFSCCNSDYDGTIKNLSEKGMFITTSGMDFPFDSELEILMYTEGGIIKAAVEVIRMTKSRGCYNALGVKVLNPSAHYLAFVQSFK